MRNICCTDTAERGAHRLAQVRVVVTWLMELHCKQLGVSMFRQHPQPCMVSLRKQYKHGCCPV